MRDLVSPSGNGIFWWNGNSPGSTGDLRAGYRRDARLQYRYRYGLQGACFRCAYFTQEDRRRSSEWSAPAGSIRARLGAASLSL